MKYATNCRFCQKPITLDIDDDYARLGDPRHLLGLATCEACASLRREREKVEALTGRVCYALRFTDRKDYAKVEELKSALTRLSQRYCQLIARWHHMNGSLWDESIVEALMQDPDRWGEILSQCWRTFNDWKARQSEMAM